MMPEGTQYPRASADIAGDVRTCTSCIAANMLHVFLTFQKAAQKST